jgi:osmotically-inducible protein OsmY
VNYTITPTGTVIEPTTTIHPSPSMMAYDSDLVINVQSSINTDPALRGSNIRVSSNQGIITLDGTAANQLQIDAAIQSVKNMNGVRNVKSNIRISPTP